MLKERAISIKATEIITIGLCKRAPKSAPVREVTTPITE